MYKYENKSNVYLYDVLMAGDFKIKAHILVVKRNNPKQ